MLLLTALLAILAASTPHVTLATSVNRAPAAPGKTLALYIDVIPDPNIHVYAPGAKGYLPIGLEIKPQSGIKPGALRYPKSQIYFFEPTRERIPVYQTPFRLVQNVTLASSLEPGQTLVLSGTLTYQACDDAICYKPVSAPLRWTIEVR
jgi:hypothetical protein